MFPEKVGNEFLVYTRAKAKFDERIVRKLTKYKEQIEAKSNLVYLVSFTGRT